MAIKFIVSICPTYEVGQRFLLKNIKIIKEFLDEIVPVRCDPDAISFVLPNLISNAIKYLTRDGIITAKIERADNNSIRISIKNCGIGIASEEIDKIFSGFYRTKDGMKQAKGF